MGLSAEKIAEVMEARLHETAHRHPQRHDSRRHTGFWSRLRTFKLPQAGVS
jgi:hypothetical protein